MLNGGHMRGKRSRSMLGAGIEPAWDFVPRDFKSLASTGFATRAERRVSANRRAAAPARRRIATLTPKRKAGNGTRTRDPNLGKVVLYQLSYSRKRRLSYREKRRQQALRSTPAARRFSS